MTVRGPVPRSSASLHFVWLIVSLAATVAGCGGPRYDPIVPMQSGVEDITIRFKGLQPLSRQFTFEARCMRAHRVRGAWLTVPTRAACTAGADAEAIRVEGMDGNQNLLPGVHALSVKFGSSARSYEEDLVVYFDIDRALCLRVPVLSQSIPMEPRQTVVLTAALQAEGNTDLSGLGGLFGVRVGAGTWLGPILTTAEVGVVGAQCTRRTCGQDAKGQLNFGTALPVALNARAFPLWMANGGIFSTVVLGARYAVVPVRLPGLQGDRHFVVHGFHGILGWTIGDAVKGPFRHTERTPLFEFDIPLGIWLYPQASTHTVSFGTGLDVQLDLPVL